MIQSTLWRSHQRNRGIRDDEEEDEPYEPSRMVRMAVDQPGSREASETEHDKKVFGRSVTMRPQSAASSVLNEEDFDDNVRVEFFADQSFVEHLKVILVKRRSTAVLFRSCNFFLKSLSAVLYVFSFINGPPSHDARCYGCDHPTNITYPNYNALMWVERGLYVYVIQVIVAYVSMLETLLLLVLEYRGNIIEQLLSMKTILESVCSLPFMISVIHPKLINVYVPSFLNCWLAKQFLEKIVLLSVRNSATLYKHLINLLSFIFCLMFTCVCGMHYLERTQQSDTFDMFNSFWFVVVTFSTVGYGDITPHWEISKLFVLCTICLALILIPIQLEQISFVFAEHQKQGGTYSHNRAEKERHVVLVTSKVTEDLVRDFVSEFYAYSELQDYYVLLLSAGEYDTYIKTILENPICGQRVIYMQGSALKFDDLVKAKAHYAECCFVLSSRHVKDAKKEDEATILRAWSVNDFAPHCPLYIQILAPENKVHVAFADYVVCEDELKYALMASNCICPAMSTYISLLVHTLEGRDVSKAEHEWERLFGHSTAQEIYDMRVEKSKFFQEFIGASFTYAAVVSHKKYGCLLIGVRPAGRKIMLNPGLDYTIREDDTCYFFNITGEEETQIFKDSPQSASKGASTARANIRKLQQKIKRRDTKVRNMSQTDSGISNVTARPYSELREEEEDFTDVVEAVLSMKQSHKAKQQPEYVQAYPTPAYQYFSAPLCFLLPENCPACCLDLFKACDHCAFTNALEYNFANKITLISVETMTLAIANFIVPLRHHMRELSRLSPIIIMTEYKPDISVLAAISCYPHVYYCHGYLENMNDLIRAGITQTQILLVTDRESSKSAEESYLADSSLIVAVQTLQRLFPNLPVITELTFPTNMKFLDFKPKENVDRNLTFKMKKNRRTMRALEKLPVDSDLFRPPFMAGTAVSCTMNDTLLYQSFIKPYIISIVYLMIGLKQNNGSGHLIFDIVTEEMEEEFQTFGRYFCHVAVETGDLPIGIYRSQEEEKKDAELNLEKEVETTNELAADTRSREQAITILKDRLLRLGVDPDKATAEAALEAKKKFSMRYVVVNPPDNCKIKRGDVVYLVRPPNQEE